MVERTGGRTLAAGQCRRAQYRPCRRVFVTHDPAVHAADPRVPLEEHHQLGVDRRCVGEEGRVAGAFPAVLEGELVAFSVNLPSQDMVVVTDHIGMVSGRQDDKRGIFDVFHGELDTAPMIEPCRVDMSSRKYWSLGDPLAKCWSVGKEYEAKG